LKISSTPAEPAPSFSCKIGKKSQSWEGGKRRGQVEDVQHLSSSPSTATRSPEGSSSPAPTHPGGSSRDQGFCSANCQGKSVPSRQEGRSETTATHQELNPGLPQLNLARVVVDCALEEALDERNVGTLDFALPRNVVEVGLRGEAGFLLTTRVLVSVEEGTGTAGGTHQLRLLRKPLVRFLHRRRIDLVRSGKRFAVVVVVVFGDERGVGGESLGNVEMRNGEAGEEELRDGGELFGTVREEGQYWWTVEGMEGRAHVGLVCKRKKISSRDGEGKEKRKRAYLEQIQLKVSPYRPDSRALLKNERFGQSHRHRGSRNKKFRRESKRTWLKCAPAVAITSCLRSLTSSNENAICSIASGSPTFLSPCSIAVSSSPPSSTATGGTERPSAA
jgi:hypothetical protein